MIAKVVDLIKMSIAAEKNPEIKKLAEEILKDYENHIENHIPKQHQPTTEIFEYITKRLRKKTHKVGVIVGFKEGDKVLIGWSKANTKAGDQFDKEKGLELAKMRAKGLAPMGNIPASEVRKLTEFHTRCIRYFKDAKFIQLAK